ncbi:AGAMOUS-like 53 [Raphanus sativus]|uniref:Agamous-like MADS-box protein AGL53 n=1 Tax=Raphanus sativus TaxID=3726 RepID=A0A6J0K930_RAPSA|nr:agamous-like MADS-box protein AGL53 [Raphanus sativus]KAJ4884166.1 AGAMOUS-like 53 [Raphanus sativus]
MTTTTTKNKLSVRKDRVFKKPSSSLHKARAATVLKKAFELSELCGIDVCIIWYDREGNLVMTWPEKEEGKVRAMAERYSMLSEQEKNKKSNNLSGFLNKKMIRDKKESLSKRDNKFFQQVSELEDSLQSRLQTLQESLLLDLSSNDSTLINAYHHQASSLLNYPSSSTATESCVDDVSTTTTTTSMNHPQSNFSILLYNHDDGTFTQLANSSALPSFEQEPQIPCDQDYGYLDLLLGEQGMRGCNSFDLLPTTSSTILPSAPLMQTQTPNFQQFMQTQQAYDPSFGPMLS